MPIEMTEFNLTVNSICLQTPVNYTTAIRLLESLNPHNSITASSEIQYKHEMGQVHFYISQFIR